MSEKVHWTDIALTIIGLIISFLTLKWLRNLAWIKDGVDKKEFAAFVFIGLLVYMTYIDARREHEWQQFSDLHYLVSYLFIAVGLGLKEILDTIKDIKGVNKNKGE